MGQTYIVVVISWRCCSRCFAGLQRLLSVDFTWHFAFVNLCTGCFIGIEASRFDSIHLVPVVSHKTNLLVTRNLSWTQATSLPMSYRMISVCTANLWLCMNMYFYKAVLRLPYIVQFSFIHCGHLYSASSSGATQKRSQPQRGQIMF